MKVLFVADVPVGKATSGSERVLDQQTAGLTKEKAVTVCALTRGGDFCQRPCRQQVNGIEERRYWADVHHAGRFCKSLLRYPQRLFQELLNEGPLDAIICHQPFTGFALLKSSKFRHIPMLYVFHSPSYEEYLMAKEHRRGPGKQLQVLGRRIIELCCVRQASKVMVLSEYMKGIVHAAHGVALDRIVVNPGGADLEETFKPPDDRMRLKQQLGLPEGKIHLLTIRNLEPRMGLDNLLNCMQLLKKNGAKIHLTMGGMGVEQQNLARLVRELELSDVVNMIGFIPSAKLPMYYGAADFFILPTAKMEGFGLIIPESLACGTPVLGTPVGAINEVISGLDPGFLFESPSPDAMARGILSNLARLNGLDEAYRQLRIRCRQHAEKNYSWKRHVTQLRYALNEITSHERRYGASIMTGHLRGRQI